jgi:subtilisin family serine protease
MKERMAGLVPVALRTSILALTVSALGAPAALAAQERPAAPPVSSSASSRIIVEWEPGVTRGERLGARAGADAALVRTLGATEFQLLRPEPGQSVAGALAELRADPAVRVATRDGYDVPSGIPNDPLMDRLWGLLNLGVPGIGGFPSPVAGADVAAPAAWDRAVGRPSTVVAILDSGYRFEHPDLAPVAWVNSDEVAGNGLDDDGNGRVDDTRGFDFVGADANSPRPDADPTDDDLFTGGHGVHVAGTAGAAGNDGVGVTGVARNVRIMPLRVCGPDSSAGDATCPFSSQIAAINYAGANGARVANMSLGGSTFSAAVRDAIAANPQTLFVIAAGNGGTDGVGDDNDARPQYPCSYQPTDSRLPGAIDNVVCVAATDQADQLAGFSNYGARSVDLGAPGTETLSSYPWDVYVADSFEVDDFAASWQPNGANGGFARTNESPLTSFGMSDSPGATPIVGTTRASVSTPVTLAPGYPVCTLSQTRVVELGRTGVYSYSVLLNGSSIATVMPGDTAMRRAFLDLSGPELAAGGRLQLRFAYSAGSSPQAGDGVWLDDVEFVCPEPVGQSASYGFLAGTSMATPHVAGAAALLFSLDPSATVSEVRAALLAGVDALPALDGRTVAGGRLNAAAALDALVPPGTEVVPPETAILAGPSGTTTARVAPFQLRRTDADLVAGFECRLDGALAFSACSAAPSFAVGLGAHVLQARARSPGGLLDPSPATRSWTVVAQPSAVPPVIAPAPRVVVKCRVPRLKGKTLRRAKRALRRAHCSLGRVTRPRRRSGRRPPLVVAFSRPRAGAVRAAGAKVRLTLKVKPRRRR